MGLCSSVQAFIEANQRYWSAGTSKSYTWYLRQFLTWLGHEYPTVHAAEEVTPKIVLAYLDSRRTWGSSTMFTAIIVLRGFFRFCVGAEASPAEEVPLPKRRMKPQRTLDEKKIERLLAALDTSTPKGIRDTAIVLLLLDSGMRSSELCRLQLRHIDIDGGTFSVKVKGGAWAEGVFCEYTAEQLRRWLVVRQDYAKEEVTTFFVGIGGVHPGGSMTPPGLRAIFRHMSDRLGFRFSPHDFRRTFATLAVRGGAPSRLVQLAGRWKSLQMVERYTQVLKPEDFAAYSPVARLMGLRVKDAEE